VRGRVQCSAWLCCRCATTGNSIPMNGRRSSSDVLCVRAGCRASCVLFVSVAHAPCLFVLHGAVMLPAPKTARGCRNGPEPGVMDFCLSMGQLERSMGPRPL
jgi:hypothetical protein